MEKKLTKRDYFNKIKELLANEKEIVEFCDHEIELLDNKKSKGKAKVNEQVDKNTELVYNAIASLNEKVTATELIAKCGCDLAELENDAGVITTQKVSAYLNKLVDSERVKKSTEKKKTYFWVE